MATATTTTATTTTTTTTTSSSISILLQSDIEPGGHRILLPFLTTKDRLRLSECCKGLINYRYHLLRVKITNCHHLPSLILKNGLGKLLLNQRGSGLQYLRLGHKSVLHVLDLASWGCFLGLKTLDLSNIYMGDDDAFYMERALLGGGLSNLEELNLRQNRLKSAGLEKIIRVLSFCPNLRRLDLSDNGSIDEQDDAPTEGVGRALAEVLQVGGCHLQELNLRRTHLGEEGSLDLIEALQCGLCPDLVKLDLSSCRLTSEAAVGLAWALTSTPRPNLEELRLDTNAFDDEGWAAIFDAMGAGGCPNLKKLDMDLNPLTLGEMAATALARTLRSGYCHRLQHLHLGGFVDPSSALGMLEAIKEAPLPDLRELCVKKTLVSPDHGRVLGEAIAAGALAKLDVLEVSYSPGLGDEGVAHVVAGLEAGGCPDLKRLCMLGDGIGPIGGQTLAHALASGHLRSIRLVAVGDMLEDSEVVVGDPIMAQIIEAMRHCPRLESLCTPRMGMGEEAGQALLSMLREGAWPDLSCIIVCGNPHLGSEVVGEGLAAVMEEGCIPRLERLLISRSGLRQEGVKRLLGVVDRGIVCPMLSEIEIDKCWVTEAWKDKLFAERRIIFRAPYL